MKNIDFSMTYLALKMFGKQLYANMSAAIAELVANGLDANAENIYVYMDIRDKNSATIAIFDDGDGMDETAMEKNYAVVGRNKRENLEPEEASKKMGRKGIGKLAALYLSNTYYVITKKAEQKEARAWKLDVSNFQEDNNTPQLVEVEYPFVDKIIFAEKLKKSGKGTIILLNNVLIKNFGEAAEDALEYKLANYFLTDELSKKIRLCVLRKNDDPVVFSEVKKNIAYKNMAVIFTTDVDRFANIAGDTVYYRDKNLKTKSQIYEEKREILVLPDIIETTIKDEKGKSEKVRNYITGELEIEGKKYVETTEETNLVKIDIGNYGIVVAELYPEIAPITVANFKKLVGQKFYDNLIFHRVIEDFMIQTGDPMGNGTGGSSETIKGEFSINGVINDISHVRGTLSMARQGNYPYPETEETMNSASSQFFIVHADSPHLDGQYAAFGSVVNGMDVVDIVATVSTDSADKPFIDQVLNSIRFVKEYEVSE